MTRRLFTTIRFLFSLLVSLLLSPRQLDRSGWLLNLRLRWQSNRSGLILTWLKLRESKIESRATTKLSTPLTLISLQQLLIFMRWAKRTLSIYNCTSLNTKKSNLRKKIIKCFLRKTGNLLTERLTFLAFRFSQMKLLASRFSQILVSMPRLCLTSNRLWWLTLAVPSAAAVDFLALTDNELWYTVKYINLR